MTHLQVALRNALILFPTTFVIGVLSGWAISHVREALIGAIIGLLIGCGFTVWICWMYYTTRGVLHHAGFDRKS